MSRFTRRHALRTGALGALSLAAATQARFVGHGTEQLAPGGAVHPTGTTLETAATPIGAGGYRRLRAGPGWPLVVRSDLLPPRPARQDRRTPLSSFVQFTDLHITDTESPARFEYLHPLLDGGAHRPQETLTARSAQALVRRVNGLAGGPFTGRPIDFVMTTGDNTDNHERAELDWFLAVLSGGHITPTTGDPNRYEGAQASGSTKFWHPDTAREDMYAEAGFPRIPGLLEAAIRPFTASGLRVPWYCTFGNHDNTLVGSLPHGVPILDDLYTSRYKIMGADQHTERAMARALRERSLLPNLADLVGALLASDSGLVREVTPDERRQPVTTAEFVRAHLEPAAAGPGPVGHGFTADNADGTDVFYTFEIAPGITGVSLDTTTLAGFANGSIGLHQYRWLEGVLAAGSSRYFDDTGHEVRSGATDRLFVLFSHHTSDTMDNPLPDARRLLEPRLDGRALVELLQRFPNVLAWVNGHTHHNEIIAHGHERPERGFWEINTASHIDYPQLARIIEIADNGDGTISLLCTLLEADSPYAASYDDLSDAGLAALYRELSYNDLYARHDAVGSEFDRNAELIVAGRSPAHTR